MAGPRLRQRKKPFGSSTTNKNMKTKSKLLHYGMSLLTAGAALLSVTSSIQAADKKPNNIIIWGDDVGMWNISAYHRGMMGGSAPNIDRLANLGQIVEAEGIEVDERDVDQRVERMTSECGVKPQELRERLARSGGLGRLRALLVAEQTLEYLLANSAAQYTRISSSQWSLKRYDKEQNQNGGIHDACICRTPASWQVGCG
jgi:hypothetical protein